MRKSLLLFILSGQLEAQIVFCPAGAEWRYSFIQYFQYAVVNEKITYEGNIISGSDTIKILKHAQLFKKNSGPNGWTYTHILQRGDTIFMKNAKTQNTWQILYNFNVLPGQSWQTLYAVNYTFVVNSVSTITVNGAPLKQISGYYSYNTGTPYTVSITERFGCSEFLFDFAQGNSLDSYFFQNFLCYQDSTFGSIQFTNKPCDFADYVGLEEEGNNSEFGVFPNPTSGRITLKSQDGSIKDLEIMNVMEQKVYAQSGYINGELDISFLPEGVYFLYLKNKEGHSTIKIVKQ